MHLRSVLEFTAPEGTCYLPFWMMSNLALAEGRMIRVRNVSLPKATFVKFQPQHVDFLEISNPRAVLEYKLRSFSCVTVGDVLTFSYNNRKYHLEVR
jgi:ubiquitin fusion degradation protein 1